MPIVEGEVTGLSSYMQVATTYIVKVIKDKLLLWGGMANGYSTNANGRICFGDTDGLTPVPFTWSVPEDKIEGLLDSEIQARSDEVEESIRSRILPLADYFIQGMEKSRFAVGLIVDISFDSVDGFCSETNVKISLIIDGLFLECVTVPVNLYSIE